MIRLLSNFFLTFQGKYEQAEPLYLRAIKISEAALGPHHPDVAVVLNNRAEMLNVQVRAKRCSLKKMLLQQ